MSAPGPCAEVVNLRGYPLADDASTAPSLLLLQCPPLGEETKKTADRSPTP